MKRCLSLEEEKEGKNKVLLEPLAQLAESTRPESGSDSGFLNPDYFAVDFGSWLQRDLPLQLEECF